MIENINFQIWFKVCRPLKRKYKLSTNCIMVLNGAYIYTAYINRSFTRRKLLDFCSYYDNRRIGNYMTVLMSNGYIKENGLYKCRQLYCVSELGLKVMEEFKESYEKELSKFVSLYNISL